MIQDDTENSEIPIKNATIRGLWYETPHSSKVDFGVFTGHGQLYTFLSPGSLDMCQKKEIPNGFLFADNMTYGMCTYDICTDQRGFKFFMSLRESPRTFQPLRPPFSWSHFCLV